MGYIHYTCLKQCIKVRITKKESDNYICYLWKNYECEICLQEYPKYIKYKKVLYNLIDYTIPYDEYLIFDYTLFDDHKKKTSRKGLIIVKINDEENISIGRNQTNIIKLKDISVSRSHCYIFKKDGKIFIADKSSKFGTLLYLNKPFTITNNSSMIKNNSNSLKNPTFIDSQVNLVSGKNFFEFKMATTWSIFGNLFSNTFCCRCKSTEEDYVLNLDPIKEYDDNIFGNNFNGNSTNNDGSLFNHFNDSYLDYCMDLETIIKNENEDISGSGVNNNNSFI